MKGGGTLRETKSYNWWEGIDRKCLPEVNSYSQPPNSPFCAYTHSTEISLCWFNKVCACIRNASTPGRFVRLLGSFIFLLVENKSAPVFHFRIKTNKQTKSVLSVTGDRLEAVTARRWRAATTKKQRQKATEVSRWPFSERLLNLHGWKETWQCSGAESVGKR